MKLRSLIVASVLFSFGASAAELQESDLKSKASIICGLQSILTDKFPTENGGPTTGLNNVDQRLLKAARDFLTEHKSFDNKGCDEDIINQYSSNPAKYDSIK